MGASTLRIGCFPYDSTRALFDGTVGVDGIDATFHTAPTIPEIFERMVRDHEFDVAELGLTFYLRTLDQHAAFVAIPVFPNRLFRHSCVFVNADSGIDEPRDLHGKTVGAPRGAALSELLETGDIDALFSANVPQCVLDGSPPVRRLFPNFESVERDYHRRTGIFPIMHTVVFRRDVLDARPELALPVYQAFRAAKDAAVERYEHARRVYQVTTMVPWMNALFERNRDLLPTDWWPYGVAANRTKLATVLRYHFEQGLSARRLSVEEIFAPALLEV